MALSLYTISFLLFTAGLLQHCYANGAGIVAALHQHPVIWMRYRRFRLIAWALTASGLLLAFATHQAWR